MLMFNACLIICLLLPAFYALQFSTFLQTIAVLLLFSIASALEQGTTSIALVENFPLPARYTGLAFGYNVGNGFLGGTVPFICQWLYKYIQPMAAPFYVMCCAIITAIVIYFYVPETKGSNIVV